jgi:predicted TIM-barrel fold metal-dependent hydrolase
MIIDSHTHAWETWPYEPAVPDPASRGRVDQLLWEMDRNGVDQAVVVCARIDHNPGNNDYVAAGVRRYPERLIQFADVDCSWTDSYHRPGGADRLAAAADAYGLKGFTHYLKGDIDWFETEDALAFFTVAAERRLIASLALGPEWQPALRRLARRFPSVPFLCHHMAGARAAEAGGPHEPGAQLAEILRSAEVPNIYVKLSGFHYVSHVSWNYPYSDTLPVVRRLYESFGPDRLCWGSDYPVVRFHMTYRQALEALRTHCAFIPAADQAKILGGTLQRLLAAAG